MPTFTLDVSLKQSIPYADNPIVAREDDQAVTRILEVFPGGFRGIFENLIVHSVDKFTASLRIGISKGGRQHRVPVYARLPFPDMETYDLLFYLNKNPLASECDIGRRHSIRVVPLESGGDMYRYRIGPLSCSGGSCEERCPLLKGGENAYSEV